MIAYGLGMAAVLVVLFAPLVTTVSSMSASVGSGPGSEIEVVSATTTMTLLESEGLSVLFLVAIPVAVIGAGLAAVLHGWARTAAVCTTLLWTFVVLGYFSVGLFFAPSAVALVVATVRIPKSAALPG